MADFETRAAEFGRGGEVVMDAAQQTPQRSASVSDDSRRAAAGGAMRKVRVTLKELVEAVQDTAGSDEECVAVLTHLLKSVKLKAERPLPAVAA